jgi:hypothetical protein
MSEIVRLVSDGEELVLWRDEAYPICSKPDGRDSAVKRKAPSAALPIAIQYLGFQDVKGRRQYALRAQRGDQARRYTVWIELSAFSDHQALLQNGPDICYQKLLRELGGSELQASDGIGVTEGDLAAYRETHPLPARRSFSPPSPPQPAKASPAISRGERGEVA